MGKNWERLRREVKSRRWLIFWAALIAFSLGFAVSFHPACTQVYGAEGHQEDCKNNTCVCPSALTLGADWIARNKDTFEGLSTFFVALFTFTLWRATVLLWNAGERQARHAQRGLRVQIASTKKSLGLARDAAEAAKKSADAADLSAKAAIAAELPFIQVTGIENNIGPSDDLKQWFEGFSPTINFHNHGRTPAIIKEVLVNYRIRNNLPDPPEYTVIRRHPKRFVVEGKTNGSYRENGFESDNISDDDVAYWAADKSTYIYGYIRYDDFMGLEHRRGFVFRMLPGVTTYGWWGDVHKEYDYQT